MGVKDKIEDLQNHLFVTIGGLLDKGKPLNIECAKAMTYVGSVTIEFVKMEMKALEIIGSPDGSRSTFLQTSWENSK